MCCVRALNALDRPHICRRAGKDVYLQFIDIPECGNRHVVQQFLEATVRRHAEVMTLLLGADQVNS